MKSRLFLALITAAVLTPLFSAQARIGLGVVAGEPTGLTMRIDKFPVLGASWSFHDEYMLVYCDYWIINKELESPLNWYLGLGGEIGIHSDMSVGARVPIGLQWPFQQDWELFFELAPVVVLVPGADFTMNGGIGIRYFF
jgi:hypothetical protein